MTPDGVRPLTAGEGPGDETEVVVVMGIQGAGKSSHVERYVSRGYARLNRDVVGGDLEGLVPKLGELLASGQRRVVLDNTYPTRASRYSVIRKAHAYGAPVRCLFLATPLDDAYANVVTRVLERHGRLLGPDELKELGKDNPNLPPPAAMARWARASRRRTSTRGSGWSRRSRSCGARGRISRARGSCSTSTGRSGGRRAARCSRVTPTTSSSCPGRAQVLRRWVADGYALFFVSNQSGVASGTITREAADRGFARTVELLGLPVAEVAYCPHPAFPVGCFCRKPLPGLGVSLIHRHRLAREHLVMVGDLDSDEGFARGLGARFVRADAFFGEGDCRRPVDLAAESPLHYLRATAREP